MTATAEEQEIQHIDDLLFLRALFADRGVARDELRRYDAAIAKALEQLAEASRSAPAELAA
jgi:hypothetical protein